MVLSVPWSYSLYIISLQTSRINLWGLIQWDLVTFGPTLLILFPYRQLKLLIGINPTGLSAPRAKNLVIIAMQIETNYEGLTLQIYWIRQTCDK